MASAYEEALAGLGAPGSGPATAPAPTPDDQHSGASAFDEANAFAPPPPPPGSKFSLGDTVSTVLGAPKSAVDYLARKGAEAQGLPQAPGTTVGTLARSAVGLDANDPTAGYGERLTGRGVEMLADFGLDPLTTVLGEAGAIEGAGREAAAFVGPRTVEAAANAARVVKAGETAAKVGRGAALAFAPNLARAAYDEGAAGIDALRHEGLTPKTAEELAGAGVTSLFAGATLRHAVGGHGPEAPSRPTRDVAAEAAAERAAPEAPFDLEFGQPADAGAPPPPDLPNVWPFPSPVPRETQPVGETPVDILAERDMLRPDQEAMGNVEMLRKTREMLAQRYAVGGDIINAGEDFEPDLTRQNLEQALAAPPAVPRLAGTPAEAPPEMEGVRMSPAAIEAARAQGVQGPIEAAPPQVTPEQAAVARAAPDIEAATIAATGPAGAPRLATPEGPPVSLSPRSRLAAAGKPVSEAEKIAPLVAAMSDDQLAKHARYYTRTKDRNSDALRLVQAELEERQKPFDQRLTPQERTTLTREYVRSPNMRVQDRFDEGSPAERVAAAKADAARLLEKHRAEDAARAERNAQPEAPAAAAPEVAPVRAEATDEEAHAALKNAIPSLEAPGSKGDRYAISAKQALGIDAPELHGVGGKAIADAIRRADQGERTPIYEHALQAMKDSLYERQQERPELADERTADRRQRDVPVEDQRRATVRRQIQAEHPNLPPEAHEAILEDRIKRLDAEQAAGSDPVTGLRSRLAFERDLAEHRGGIASLDMAGLGYINDKLGGGHEGGDAFLRSLGTITQDLANEHGLQAYRIGGDELALLGPDVSTVHRVAQQLQDDFRQAQIHFDMPDGSRVTYTGGRIDYGTSEGQGRPGFRTADQRLYEERELAKTRGERARNKGDRPPGLQEVPGQPPAGSEVRGDHPAAPVPETLDEPRFARRPSPGQRGLPGIGGDVEAERPRERQPEQRSMFTGEMLQPTEARVTEGREGEGELFKQDEERQAREDAARQGTLGGLEVLKRFPGPEGTESVVMKGPRGWIVQGRDVDTNQPFQTKIFPFDKFTREQAEAEARKITEPEGGGSVRFAISPRRAQRLDIETKLPDTDDFRRVVAGTPGAEITADGLKIDVERYQPPDQPGNESLRTGVFYLPKGSKDARHYRTGKNGYGGSEKYEGTTLLRRPLLVKGATGGKAVERAYDAIKGPGAYEKMRRDVLNAIPYSAPHLEENIAGVLGRYDADTNLASELIRYSTKGNQLPYAIQENIAAHAVRAAGYDSVLGWSKGRGESGKPFVSEIFDVRESHYPINGEEGDVHGHFKDRAQFASKPSPLGFYSQLERVAEKIPQPMKGADMARYLTDAKRGVKADEMKWTGLDDFLRSKGDARVTPKEVQDFIAANKVDVKEVRLGSEVSNAPATDAEKEAAFAWLRDHEGDVPDETLDDYRELLNRASDGDQEASLELERTGMPDEIVDPFLRSAGEGEGYRGTKFGSYQTPGGQNYRELLLTLPTLRDKAAKDAAFERDRDAISAANMRGDHAEAERIAAGMDLSATKFTSGHFEEPNVLAHVRFNDRTDANGKKTLFIEEIQSDWAQKGRRAGFRSPVPEVGARDGYTVEQTEHQYVVRDPVSGLKVDPGKGTVGSEAEAREYAERYFQGVVKERAANQISAVPQAPFVGKTEAWSELAVKRMLRYAAENGYDQIAWTPGEMQAERYDLSKQLDRVTYTPGENRLGGMAKGSGRAVINEIVPPDKLADYVGKDVADKLLRAPLNPDTDGTQYHELSGLDLKVGGEGMKGFYDKIIPQIAGKLGKKWGATVGETSIRTRSDRIRDYAVNPTGDGGEYGVMPIVRLADNTLDYGESIRTFKDRDEAEAFADELGAKSGYDQKIHALPITDAMRRSVTEEGQPLFAPRSERPIEDLRSSTREAEANAVPVGDRFSVANAYPSIEAPLRAIAPRLMPMADTLSSALEEAGRNMGLKEPLVFKGFATDGDTYGYVSGNDVRMNIAALADGAREAADRAGIDPVPALARRLSHVLLHEALHRRLDEMAETSPEIRGELDGGGHGPAFARTLRALLRRSLTENRDLRERITAALRADDGAMMKTANDLTSIAEQGWREHGHNRFAGEEPQGSAQGPDRRTDRGVGAEPGPESGPSGRPPTRGGAGGLQPERDLGARPERPLGVGAEPPAAARNGAPAGGVGARFATRAESFPAGGPREMAPVPPPLIRTEVGGREKESGEAPRVEERIEAVRGAELETGVAPEKLDRETRESWKGLDPEVKKILRDYSDDKFYNVMGRRNLDAAETMAWDARVRGKSERGDQLREAIVQARTKGQDTASLDRELVANDLDYLAAQRASVNDGTGLGRALAARGRVMEAGQAPGDAFLKRVFREIPDVTDKQAAEILKAYHENPNNLLPLLHAAIGHNKLSWALELYRANLLTAFSTDIANISGNVVEHHMQLAQTGVSAVVDNLLQRYLGGNRARFAGEFGAEWAGANQAAMPALARLGKNMKAALTGVQKPIDVTKPIERQVGALPGKAGALLRGWSFGKLDAMDDFFKDVGGSAELGKLAYRKAARELGAGADEARVRSRAAEIVQETSDPENTSHGDLLRDVARSKLNRTFQEKREGSLTESLIQLERRHPWLGFAVPFVRVPGNIADRIIKRSPLGAVEIGRRFKAFREAERNLRDGKATQADFDEARGKLADGIAPVLIGTGILAAFSSWASAGGMTGSGPTDPKKRALLRDTGWSPYSFVFTDGKGGKTYVPFNRFEPVSSLLGFAADIAESKNARTSGDLFDKGWGSIVQNLTNKTYLQGIIDAANLASNPREFASQYIKGAAGALLVPNIVARAASALDPTVRDTTSKDTGAIGTLKSLASAVQARVPFASTALPAKRSGTGEPIERPGNAFTRFVVPAQPTADVEGKDFERYLVNELDYVPSKPAASITLANTHGKQIRLTADEYKLFEDAHQAATERMRDVLKNPRFRAMDPEEQKSYISGQYESASRSARQRLLASPAFRARARAELASV